MKDSEKFSLDNLSVDELEKFLEQKRKEEKQEEANKRAKYEAQRNVLVINLVERAEKLHKEMAAFKRYALETLNQFSESAKKYGNVRSNSKGGFSLRNEPGDKKVMLERNVKSEWDERADIAEQLLRDFLEDMVKSKDQQTFRTIQALLTRNKISGSFNPASINALLKIEDNYDDERWKKAMKLFKESYNNRLISMNVSFYRKDSQNKDVLIPLTFASINPEVYEIPLD